ncbi:MAG: hypothetical protein HQK58_06610 [Deltaproteobacteria bacterium]|nr:hypothetical protein [Deltaproteobacteria bacterium]
MLRAMFADIPNTLDMEDEEGLGPTWLSPSFILGRLDVDAAEFNHDCHDPTKKYLLRELEKRGMIR